MGFRTGVRRPSGPLFSQASNPVPSFRFAVFRNVFSLSVELNQFQTEDEDADLKVTFVKIQNWIKDKYGISVSNSSITQVKTKCGMTTFDIMQKVKTIPELKSEKEKLVLEAFKHFELVD